MLAKAVANESDAATFIKMAGSELVRKFIGEGARLVRDLFELAGEREPAVIFIDEIDAVAAKRTDSKTSGDAEVQHDDAVALRDGWTALTTAARSGSWPPRTASTCSTRRSCVRGRFDRLIEVPEPNAEGRARIFLEIHAGHERRRRDGREARSRPT